jgi:hypothetical protein
MYNISDVYYADPKPPSLMLKDVTGPESGGQLQLLHGLEDKQNVPKMQDQFSYELQWPTLPGK